MSTPHTASPIEQPAPPAVDISSEAADLAIQNAAMLMGSTDEWTDQESMIADFQQRLDALIADRADAHAQKESWYARATRRQRELNEATDTIARLSAQAEAAREALEPFAVNLCGEDKNEADNARVGSCRAVMTEAFGVVDRTSYGLIVGDFRRARAALAKLAEEA